MSRRPSNQHQETITRFIIALHPPVTALGGKVLPEPGLLWDEEGEDAVAPDVAVILADRLGFVQTKLRGTPNIVVEVLSAGAEARRRDLEAKRDLYWRRGAFEYWIADLEARVLHRLSRGPTGWIDERIGEDDVVRTPLLPDWGGARVGDLLATAP